MKESVLNLKEKKHYFITFKLPASTENR